MIPLRSVRPAGLASVVVALVMLGMLATPSTASAQSEFPVSAASLVDGAQSPASDPPGCHHFTGGGHGNFYTWATCDTSAPGIYFRAWIHCKHVDPYGYVTY
jgi:hypothetical protein